MAKSLQPSLQSARAAGESANQTRTIETRAKPSRRGDRSIDFFKCRVVIFSVEGGLLNCINCNPVPRGTRSHPDEASEKFASLQTDSGLQLDLEIALSGVSAKSQPLRLIQAGRRCVETSVDVIESTFISSPETRIWDFSPMR